MTCTAHVLAALLFVAGCATDPADPVGPAGQGPDSDSGTGGKGDGAGSGSACAGAPGEIDTCFGFQPIADLEQVMFDSSVVQSDGKIVVYGTAQDHSSATPYAYVPFVRRFLSDGTPDSSFAAELPAASSSSIFHPAAVKVRPDGRMIVAGSYGGSGTLQMSVQHLLASGARDPSVRSGSFWPPSSLLGYTTTAGVNKILLEQDGSYYLAGTIECIAAFTCDTRAMFVARYDAAGILDVSFGKDGFAVIKNGQHTRAIDAVRVGDATYVLGLESEPYYLGGTKTSFNRVVIGKVGAGGALDASFGTAGVFSWYASGSQLGTIPQAFQVQADGTISVATLLPTNQIVSVTSDGKTATPHVYQQDDGVRFARFAQDGSLFAEIDDYPIAAFGRYAQDGTADSTFTTATIDVPGVPAGTVFLSSGLAAVEQSDAWLVTGYLFMGTSSTPESQLVLFRLWK